MPESVRVWLENLAPRELPEGRVVLPPGAVGPAVRHVCDAAHMPSGAQRDWLVEDIARLARCFAKIMSAEFLRLRLDVVSDNACRKFHVDTLRARLVCTYRGCGTQYGTSDAGRDPVHIAQVATGAPILMRGRLWPEHPPSGMLHRSPPIEGTGETRLLLVLDPVSAPE